MRPSVKLNIAIFIALLFHISGAVGILFSPYKNWFIQNTPLNLSLMALLLGIVQVNKSNAFYIFCVAAFAVGMLTEIIGVNTQLLFGNYSYGSVMGIKVLGVPLLIGVNWLVTIYCCGVITNIWYNWVLNKYQAAGLHPKMRLISFAIVFDGAMLATYFDYLIEPVATKLGFWQWQNNHIPSYNYFCWFVISAALLWLFHRLKFNKQNHFAIHLFIIQVLFFVALRLYL